MNQYHVVMEVEPRFWQRPDTCGTIYVGRPPARRCAERLTRFEPRATALAVNHQDIPR